MESPTIAMNDKEDEDDEKKVYVTFSLAKYPFLKNKKVGETGEIKFKAEIETSEKKEDDATHHTIMFQDLINAKKGMRV